MRAIVFDGSLRFVPDYPLPQPSEGEALIRVLLAGICNTDLEIMRGYASFSGILGHEFVGVVEAAGDTNWIGQRVAGEINAACGRCAACLSGLPTHCANRTVLGIQGRNGAFADYLALPLRNLHRVPANVADEEAVFTEPLAAALQILEQVHIRPTDRVIVLGDGKLGLLVAQVLHLVGCDLLVIGRHVNKLQVLARVGIATMLVDEAPHERADVVVECTGQAAGLVLARSLVRPRGIIVLKSTYHGATELALSPYVVDEISIIGSRCGPFAPALRLLEQRLVQVRPLITACYPLSDGVTALSYAAQRGTLKVLLRP